MENIWRCSFGFSYWIGSGHSILNMIIPATLAFCHSILSPSHLLHSIPFFFNFKEEEEEAEEEASLSESFEVRSGKWKWVFLSAAKKVKISQ